MSHRPEVVANDVMTDKKAPFTRTKLRNPRSNRSMVLGAVQAETDNGRAARKGSRQHGRLTRTRNPSGSRFCVALLCRARVEPALCTSPFLLPAVPLAETPTPAPTLACSSSDVHASAGVPACEAHLSGGSFIEWVCRITMCPYNRPPPTHTHPCPRGAAEARLTGHGQATLPRIHLEPLARVPVRATLKPAAATGLTDRLRTLLSNRRPRISASPSSSIPHLFQALCSRAQYRQFSTHPSIPNSSKTTRNSTPHANF